MYSLTIIGGGEISCGYDAPSDNHIITHLHGALHHPEIEIDAIVEVSKVRQEYIRDKWGDNFDLFLSLEDSINTYKSDIVIIATPTNTHLQIMEELLSHYAPKLIICEKPIVSTVNEFSKLNSLLEKYPTKIMTHYTRRFDPSINLLKELIMGIDTIHHFYGTFAKGLLHNGSHMIDLISLLLGGVKSIEIIEQRYVNNDFFGKFLITSNKTTGVISNIDSDVSLFEFTLYTDKAKIEISGPEQDIIIHYTEHSRKFKNYTSYSKKEILENTLNKYGLNTLDYAIKLIHDDVMYNELKKEQYNVNHLILSTQQNLLEDIH